MTMSHLSKAGKSRTSIARMARPMLRRLKLGGRHRQGALQVSAAAGIAVAAGVPAVVVAAAEAVALSNGTISGAESRVACHAQPFRF